jgi:hypothetical protein
LGSTITALEEAAVAEKSVTADRFSAVLLDEISVRDEVGPKSNFP